MEVLQRTANRGSLSTGYDIDNSLKFENDNSEGLLNNYSGDGTPTKWTFSGWVKRTEIDVDTFIFAANYSNIRFISGNWIRVEMYTGSATYYYDTAALFRDTAAWYHIVFQYDSTQGTAANRTKLWVNGVLNESFGQYDTHTNLPQNATIGFGEAASNFQVGYNFVGGVNWKGYCGYMAEFHYTDGVANDADAFGEYDEDSGIWKPKAYAGLHGSKGIYLKFDDSSDLGANSASGGVGDFSLTNITAADQATDTPTNNFQTFLSDGSLFNTGANNITYSEGGTKFAKGNATAWTISYTNMAMPNGKWYMEFENHGTGKNTQYGLIPVAFPTTRAALNLSMGETTDGTVAYNLASGSFNQNGGGSGGVSSVTGDIIGIAVDKENNKAYWHKNGTYMNGANPVTGSSGTSGHYTLSDEPYFFAVATYNPNNSGKTNTGGYTAISISSAASDANGYGTFEYAPPTGYYALCTKNLAEYG